jgi:hypothetical protein
MAEWAVYFHLHTAESYTTEQDSLKAAEHADAAAELAQQQGLLEQQVTMAGTNSNGCMVGNKQHVPSRSAAASSVPYIIQLHGGLQHFTAGIIATVWVQTVKQDATCSLLLTCC